MPNSGLDKKMLSVLKMLSPGTELREGLDNILRAGTGALIVIGDSKEVIDIVYSPAHLYELAKMDGAIILSKDIHKILYANALLIPDPSISTTETGTRHKSAERAAKQTGEIVISISQRRNIITVYKGTQKYILQNISSILGKANQALQTLEKYKTVLEGSISNLSLLEFEDVVTLEDIARILQRSEMALRIVKEIEIYVCELGQEGRLVKMQLDELKGGIHDDLLLIIEDYLPEEATSQPSEVYEHLASMSNEDLTDVFAILRALGYYETRDTLHKNLPPRGYRLLNKIPRLPMVVISNMVKEFGSFHRILEASIEELDEVEGIGETRARTIKQGLKKIQDQLVLDNRYVL